MGVPDNRAPVIRGYELLDPAVDGGPGHPPHKPRVGRSACSAADGLAGHFRAFPTAELYLRITACQPAALSETGYGASEAA
jgi:hypothetical protein